MGKKKLLPGQKSPIVRSTTAKPIPGLEETALTEGMGGTTSHGVTPSISAPPGVTFSFPFAGEGDE
ncbi:cyanobactin class RiPP [Moorena sp. SIO4A5]|uniref:cyanobactin class RiPP n=1 Tax=unclassified Moorena TaxID=2683338 RepID=UPI003447CCD2